MSGFAGCYREARFFFALRGVFSSPVRFLFLPAFYLIPLGNAAGKHKASCSPLVPSCFLLAHVSARQFRRKNTKTQRTRRIAKRPIAPCPVPLTTFYVPRTTCRFLDSTMGKSPSPVCCLFRPASAWQFRRKNTKTQRTRRIAKRPIAACPVPLTTYDLLRTTYDLPLSTYYLQLLRFEHR